jgi:FlaG/FlaF family flagellin (archaellin)
MVAITVILAAVIGAFVLEIGDQQETAPSTSFDTTQETRFHAPTAWGNRGTANLTHVAITHAGGDTLSISQQEIKVEGSPRAWSADIFDQGGNTHSRFRPVPDFFRTAGSNEKVMLSSGQSWEVAAVACTACTYDKNGNTYDPVPADDSDILDTKVTGANGGYGYGLWPEGDAKGDDPGFSGPDSAPITLTAWWHGQDGWGQWGAEPLEQSDQVSVIWTASSGGKTQTLFNYDVQ